MSIAGQPLFLALAGRAIREAIGTDPGDPAMRALIAEHVIATMKAAFANPAGAAGAAAPNPSQDRTP
jgi:hypothetical protein